MRKNALGTYQIAKICQVTPPTVGRWIKAGLLPSFSTAGGHGRVWVADLLKFLQRHNIPAPKELRPRADLRILLVDDDPQVRVALKRIILKDYPSADIGEAADGFEAGQKVAEIEPTLVLLDWRMPGLDGMQVCKSIKASGRLRATKILMMSGFGAEGAAARALAAGADGFLNKPFDVVEVRAKLHELLGGAGLAVRGGHDE
ncbi:MAG: response regulator [Elusimicrobiota bacterium]|mgnify:FL=1